MIITFKTDKKLIAILTKEELKVVPKRGDFLQARKVTDEGDTYVEGYLSKTTWYFSSGNDGMPNITFTLKDRKD